MGLFSRKKGKKNGPLCSVVVVAAGSSTRMGTDKIMASLCGIPVIVHTLRAFEEAAGVEEVILVTREEMVVELAQLCRGYGLSKVRKVVRGGESRTQSVYLGVLETLREASLIAIHDGARPLIPVEVIEHTVAKAAQCGAAAPAIPVRDTIKIARESVVENTPERSALFAVQTPQVFEASLIKGALKKALDDGAALTDDCSAVERLGMKVSLVPGEERNFKLTTPYDLLLAQCLLEGGALV